MSTKTIICIGGRCSSWGKDWKRHLYGDENEDCLRCGMNRREQWEEDKFSGLVTGDYKPRTLSKLKQKHASDRLMYCALGDYGIEYATSTEAACNRWIKAQAEDNEFDPGYYSIVTHTQAELDAMPEV